MAAKEVKFSTEARDKMLRPGFWPRRFPRIAMRHDGNLLTLISPAVNRAAGKSTQA
jgi:hypothetical protein